MVRRIVLLLCASSLVAGCGETLATSGEDTEVVSASQDLFIDKPHLWSSPSIPVCWESSGSDEEKEWVRSQVRRTWEYVSRVRFTGWGTCNSSTKSGVRIKVGDTFWPASFVGTALNNRVGGMQLSFNMDKIPPNDGTMNKPFGNCGGTQRERCIRATAAHEFGHAIGFDHEQNRGDKPASCTASAGGGGSGTENFGTWDASSIMNYCNAVWNNGGRLSINDAAGIIRYYGAARDTPFVDANSGKCLDVSGGNRDDGANVQLWSCNRSDAQAWTLTADGLMINTRSGKCLDADSFGTDNGTRVQQWECHGGTNQRWAYTSTGALRNPASGRCLDVAGFDTSDGAALQLWDCHGGTNQQWTRDDMQLRSFDNELCVEVRDQAPGAIISMLSCTNDPLYRRQRWALTPSGTLVNDMGTCMDVEGFGTENGSRVHGWTCNGTSNQKWEWTSRGELRNPASGRCLDVTGFGGLGTELQLWDCLGGTNQIWRTR